MSSGDVNDKPAILLVDDEPEILNSLKGLLRRQFQLFTAESGQDALDILKDHSIHVIMTDQRMPEMTGAELLTQAAKISPNSVRIMFTGYADIKAVVDAVNNGHLYCYITKPWDPDDLVDLLQEASQAYAKGQRQRKLLADVDSFLKELTSGDDIDQLRRRGEALRSQVELELQNRDTTD